MIELDGKKFITDKEASVRYGRSRSWFQRQRHKKMPPPFVKLQGKGTVYYCLSELDQWFKDNFLVYK